MAALANPQGHVQSREPSLWYRRPDGIRLAIATASAILYWIRVLVGNSFAPRVHRRPLRKQHGRWVGAV